jgi:hypothetical protein
VHYSVDVYSVQWSVLCTEATPAAKHCQDSSRPVSTDTKLVMPRECTSHSRLTSSRLVLLPVPLRTLQSGPSNLTTDPPMETNVMPSLDRARRSHPPETIARPDLLPRSKSTWSSAALPALNGVMRPHPMGSATGSAMGSAMGSARGSTMGSATGSAVGSTISECSSKVATQRPCHPQLAVLPPKPQLAALPPKP